MTGKRNKDQIEIGMRLILLGLTGPRSLYAVECPFILHGCGDSVTVHGCVCVEGELVQCLISKCKWLFPGMSFRA